jgi:hypothetical protein
MSEPVRPNGTPIAQKNYRPTSQKEIVYEIDRLSRVTRFIFSFDCGMRKQERSDHLPAPRGV